MKGSESGWKCPVANLEACSLYNHYIKKDKLSFEGPKPEKQCNSNPWVNFSIIVTWTVLILNFLATIRKQKYSAFKRQFSFFRMHVYSVQKLK